MKLVEWSMQGVEFGHCNCAFGCPCQFNSLPTHGDCRALTFVQIEKGRFGDVPLDGLRWGILASWPGPIHLGNGTFQSIVDERADPKQRAALESVSHGRETEPGKLIWQVFSTTVTKVQPTLFKPIELTINVKARTAKLNVPGIIEAAGRIDQEPCDRRRSPSANCAPDGLRVHRGGIRKREIQGGRRNHPACV